MLDKREQRKSLQENPNSASGKGMEFMHNDAPPYRAEQFTDTLNKMVTGGDTLFEIFDVLKSLGRECDAKKLTNYYSNMKTK